MSLFYNSIVTKVLFKFRTKKFFFAAGPHLRAAFGGNSPQFLYSLF